MWDRKKSMSILYDNNISIILYKNIKNSSWFEIILYFYFILIIEIFSFLRKLYTR